MTVPSDFTGKTAIVTGSSGLVGRRLCELLAERGAAKVIGLDISEPPVSPGNAAPSSYAVIETRLCDITDSDAVVSAMEPADCVWHMAALVGPFYPQHAYKKVNYHGTLNVLKAVRHHGICNLVYSSSPSTRFDGLDVSGLKESDLTIREPGTFLEPYAEWKAQGEIAVHEENGKDGLYTVTIAPHQVYGPRDPLFLPNLMEASRTGKLRVFGKGKNEVSMVHVDNYCHGLILGYHALNREETRSRAGGQFIIVTDGGKVNFWDVLDDASVQLGFGSVRSRMAVPRWLLMGIALMLQVVGRVLGKSFKITPFTVKMLTIDRWFDITKAREVLGYEPLFPFQQGWQQTIDWYKNNTDFLDKCAKKTSKNKVFEKRKDE